MVNCCAIMVNNEIYIESEYFKKENTMFINAIIHIRDKNEEYTKIIDALQVVELMFKDKIQINIKLKKTQEKNLFVSFHNQTIFQDCDKLDSYIYIVQNILNKKSKKEKERLNMYKEKDFFDLPKAEQEAIKNALNNIVYEYELDEVCEIILFQFLKQFYAEQYSELDYTFLVNKIVLSSKTIKRNINTLLKKGILKYKDKEKVYQLSEEILKPFSEKE